MARLPLHQFEWMRHDFPERHCQLDPIRIGQMDWKLWPAEFTKTPRQNAHGYAGGLVPVTTVNDSNSTPPPPPPPPPGHIG